MSNTYHSGFTGKTLAGTNELSIKGWDARSTSDAAEFKNSKTGNTTKKEALHRHCTANINVSYDFDNQCFGTSSATLAPGNLLTNLFLYLHGSSSSNDAVVMPSALITEVGIGLQIDQTNEIMVPVTVVNDGTFTLPGATVI